MWYEVRCVVSGKEHLWRTGKRKRGEEREGGEGRGEDREDMIERVGTLRLEQKK